ncbi:MAG TPA: PBP1A family penicillin-binding protein [Thermodesulfobacteriota bacterium]|nr:PBP1A family penicillin-binding protein [Thermodesulfobacteriota bacterium]
MTKPGKKKNKEKKKGGWATLVLILVLGVVLLIVAGVAFYFTIVFDLPRLTTLKDYSPYIVSEVYSEDETLIGEFFVERRTVVPLAQMPRMLSKAFVAAEDARFFEHRGIDYWRILGAAFRNIEALDVVQGGSTITQQIAKSFFLTPERSFVRKVKEAILAQRIEHYLTKNEILFLYLNQIYLGEGAYGVGAAATTYFGKPVQNLTLAECALLAGLPPSPNNLSPLRHPKKARERQLYVLNRMVERRMISKDQAQKAQAEEIKLRPRGPKSYYDAPYVVEQVRQYVEQKYGTETLYKGGLKIYTTINSKMQKWAQKAVQKGLEEFEERGGKGKGREQVQGALVALDPTTGYIMAMVGGRDFSSSQFNRATQAKRQAGSAFKPIVYAAALDKGFTPATIIVDEPFSYIDVPGKDPWQPQNFDREFWGPITLRKALTFSRNVPTVKIAQSIGVDYLIDYAENLGIKTKLEPNLSLALGSANITLLDLTRVFGVFASQGYRAEPILINQIQDKGGNVLEETEPSSVEVISPQTAYLITSLMQSVIQEGTGQRAKALGRPAAGKTGTTNDTRDAWFVGYIPQKIVAGAWIGYDIEKSLGSHETGAVAALPIWLEFMKDAVNDIPSENFAVPDGIIFVRVDKETGEPVAAGRGGQSSKVIFECFKEGTEPAGVPRLPDEQIKR